MSLPTFRPAQRKALRARVAIEGPSGTFRPAFSPKARERFWAKVPERPEGDCWIWRGACSVGYGSFDLRHRRVPAHRVAYEMVVGRIPEGLHIDHLCRNRACVNPEHLEAVTQGENNRRAWRARDAARCRNGHGQDRLSRVCPTRRRYRQRQGERAT